MNKMVLKLWLETKMDSLNFKKEFSKESKKDIDAQILILKELYDDFNLDECGLEYLQNI